MTDAALMQLYHTKAEIRGPDECWPWHGTMVRSDRRGTYSYRDKTYVASHLAWFVRHHEWPRKGIFVCHSCDNPNCVNPAHLWLGTHSDNMKDCARKHRLFSQQSSAHLAGSRNHNAKMTENLVRIMRGEYRAGVPMRAIARKYGMTSTPVREAIIGKAWKHVE